MAERKALYVSPKVGDWLVHWRKESWGTIFSSKSVAIANARKIVQALPAGEVSQIIVERADGTFQIEWTYGVDPFPPG